MDVIYPGPGPYGPWCSYATDQKWLTSGMDSTPSSEESTCTPLRWFFNHLKGCPYDMTRLPPSRSNVTQIKTSKYQPARLVWPAGWDVSSCKDHEINMHVSALCIVNAWPSASLRVPNEAGRSGNEARSVCLSMWHYRDLSQYMTVLYTHLPTTNTNCDEPFPNWFVNNLQATYNGVNSE